MRSHDVELNLKNKKRKAAPTSLSKITITQNQRAHLSKRTSL